MTNLRLSSTISSARESDGEPRGDGDDEGLDDARRDRLLFGTGTGEAETRVGAVRRFSGVEGPAEGWGESAGDPKPNPWAPGRWWAGWPKPKPKGDIDAGAPNARTFGGCWVRGWAMLDRYKVLGGDWNEVMVGGN